MSHTELDHDGRRELEQRALLNVSRLAEKLGYQDALDRKQERILMTALGLGLVVVVAVLYIGATMKSNADADDLARKRCEVAVRVEVTPAVRQEVLSEPGNLGPDFIGRLVEEKVRAIAASKCAVPAT